MGKIVGIRILRSSEKKIERKGSWKDQIFKKLKKVESLERIRWQKTYWDLRERKLQKGVLWITNVKKEMACIN